MIRQHFVQHIRRWGRVICVCFPLSLVSGLYLVFAADSPKGGHEQTLSNSIGMKFVHIKPGTFTMGSSAKELGRDPDETEHQVTLTKAFYMQTTEVTQGQWKAVMGNNPSSFKDCGANCPVETVSWDDCQDFIRKLGQKEKNNYRLPTEAEWEYACRAETTTPFSFGACLSTDQANYDGDCPLDGCNKGKYRNTTVHVASFQPNAWGLYDMHGNVREWCQDGYAPYPRDAVTDPLIPASGGFCVSRGGEWSGSARGCRCANRGSDPKCSGDDLLGFRLVMTVK